MNAYFDTQSCKHVKLTVHKCGLFIDEQHPFLCATPDAVINCDCCGCGLLEVKCPLTSAGLHPKDAKLPYLIGTDSKLVLRRSHKYYTQVQCQMAVTKRMWCDFFVYSKKGYHLESIHFESCFWDERVETIEKGYYEYVLPYFVGKEQTTKLT